MKLKLIGEILEGLAFHYHGRSDRIFIKRDKNTAVTPEGKIRRMSPTTLVVPHEGDKKSQNGGKNV